MKPVDQTTFGFPGGNCFSACVASLLEMPLDEVPYFMGDELGDDGGKWYERFKQWLKPRGYYPLCFLLNDEWRPDGLHILSGKSPREPANPDALHSVVASGNTIVHDPHPSREGLADRKDVTILIPIDPGKTEQLSQLLADTRFYLERQDIRAIGGIVNMWRNINEALRERVDAALIGVKP